MRILTIVGARPQFVKAAALSRALSNFPNIEEQIVHTGQHFDSNMSDVFFEEMNIPKPKHNLSINSLGHGAMTGRMLEQIETLILNEKPDLLLVYGDTNSTLAGALAAKKLHVKVGHVEAGLRSFNMQMPEEINRILTDRISDHLFCPTDTAIKNLENEGYSRLDCQVHRTGDVMQDAALYYLKMSAEKCKTVNHMDLSEGFALVTIHRAENTDNIERLSSIVRALNRINTELKVVCPIHPRTKKILEQQKLKVDFTTINPVGYFDMIELLKKSTIVLTDSGGLQKEAFFFESPCVTMRDQTEWVELVENGYNKLAGADEDLIVEAFTHMVDQRLDFSKDLYGKGNAANAIAEIISKI